ncbi:MAG: site-specific DNA-methyltransferase [Candidatus Hydrothermia bacterium]|jgi:site-specific DNA-methyltransferase (adenine-specific)|nr:site-specific DNA-methyltransferase [Candidatus Hydrothermia bacterium]
MSGKDISVFVDKVIEGDAIEVMREIPDNSVDMTFADPPFNLGKRYNNYHDKKRIDEYLEWCRLWLKEMVRITKPTGSIFVHHIPKWLTYFAGFLNEIAYFRHWIVWDAMSSPLGKTLLPSHYGILWYTKEKRGFKFYDIRSAHPRCRNCGIVLQDYGGKKNKMHPYGPLISDVWKDIHRIKHKKRRDEHPCQLPIPLLERLILMTTDEGDIVLDPFVGTGTTAIAAKRLGRKYIAIDIDSKYVKIAREKLENVQPTKINNVYVSIYLGKIITIRDKDWENIKFLNKFSSEKSKINNRIPTLF